VAIGEESDPDGSELGSDGGATTPTDAAKDAHLRKTIEERDRAKAGERKAQADLLGMRHSLTPEQVAELADVSRDQQEQAAKAMAYDQLQAAEGQPSTQGAPAGFTSTEGQPAAPAAPAAPTDPAPQGAAAMATTPGGPAAPAAAPSGEQVIVDAMKGTKSQAELDDVLRNAQGQVRRGEIEDPVKTYQQGQR
jgi:hypothetical protein